jgi:hypothetical protein
VFDFTDIAGQNIVEFDDNGNMVEVDGNPLFVEGLDAAVNAHWDYDQMMEIPDSELSTFLGLSEGDVGYVAEDSGGGNKPTGTKKPRRSF